MKITDVKTFLIHPGTSKNWLFIKVETDEGIAGWGEAYTQADRDRSVEITVQQLRRYLVGRSPFDIKHFTYMAYTDFATRRGSMEFYCAVSGIEHALWDIAGKATGQPVYNLLGGAARTQIRVYANGWGGGSLEKLTDAAKEVVARGFTAMKFDPFPNPWRAYISRQEEDIAVERVAAVREAVGPDVEILVEVHRRLAPMHAVRVARRLEPYRPYWYEEPVSARDMAGLAEVRRETNLPIVTGEELYTKADFRAVFEQRAADIINPDVCNCGGILELREIAAMAEVYHVVVSPHNYNSMVLGLAATVHAAAGMPNFLIAEYFVNFEEMGKQVAKPLVPVKGVIELPTAPGLGVEIDEDALAHYAYQEFPTRNLRRPMDEKPL